MKKILAVILAVFMLAVNVHSADARLRYDIPYFIIEEVEGSYEFVTPEYKDSHMEFDYDYKFEGNKVTFTTGVGYVKGIAKGYDLMNNFSSSDEFFNATDKDFDKFVMNYEVDVENLQDIFIEAFYIYVTDVDFEKTCNSLYTYMKNHVMEFKAGWHKLDNKWYFYDNNIKATGWVKDGAKWYLLDSTGAMLTGWQKVDGKWYFLDSYMKTGWVKDNGKWYYLNSHMLTGWIKDNNKWYYLNTHMQTGWVKVNGTWYYLNEKGAMVTGNVKINGKVEKFNSKGVWMG